MDWRCRVGLPILPATAWSELTEAGGNKTRAAELIGLPSYQTLTNWMKGYDVALPDRARHRRQRWHALCLPDRTK